MPPRRSRRILGSVVRTTTKVVEETVEVTVVEKESQSVTQEPEAAETAGGQTFRRTIPVEETATTPARASENPETLESLEPSAKITEDIETTPKSKTDSDAKRQAGEGRRRKKKGGGRGGEGYKRYLFVVLKQVHPGMGISGQAMVILNNLMNDMFERLVEEATRLSKYTGRKTLSSREIQGAVRLVVPGELGKHAIAEGTKAVSTFVSNHGLPKH